MEFEKQNRPSRQSGLTPTGLQRLQDAADPDRPHIYEWYVIADINAPGERMARTPELESAIRAYAGLDCADKRLGVTKDGIAAVDLIIRQHGHERVPADWLRSECFKADPVVAAALAEIKNALHGRTGL